MAPDDSSGARPAAPIVLRIKLRYDDVELMVQRFAPNVGKSGLFLPTKSIQPVGAEVKFELRLSDDTPALVGLGRVKASIAPDPQNPRAPFGMAIELMRVTPQSRALILRMLERRRELGLPEVALPLAADIEAARRAEAVVAARDSTSGPVPLPVAPSGPVASPSAQSNPGIALAPLEPGESLLTAPRRQTGPMTVAKVTAVAPLAPEPPRRRRPVISELIESASGPIASVSVAGPGLPGLPGIDEEIDLTAALARARALTTVLPIRLGGALALLEAAPEADLVFCAHSGFDGIRSLKDFASGAFVGARIVVRFFRVPRGHVPLSSEGRAAWLHELWQRVDALSAPDTARPAP